MNRRIRDGIPRPTRIEYEISIDPAFVSFAIDRGVKPEFLFEQAENAILTRHHRAVPDRASDGQVRTGVWCLDFGPACVIYAVQDGTAVIQEFLSNANGSYYEPSQDLLAGMVEVRRSEERR